MNAAERVEIRSEAELREGYRPKLALVVEIAEIFHHCSKAFLRSELWNPETWNDVLPSRARISKALERPEDSLEELERYYGPDYAKGIYAG